MFSRRNVLKLGVGIAAATALDLKYFRIVENALAQSSQESLFIRSTDSPNCTGACGFIAQVNNGRISTLIQAADYPEAEYNPRGCLRGLSMMNLIYGKDRLKYPLIRTGERGSGFWQEMLRPFPKKQKIRKFRDIAIYL